MKAGDRVKAVRVHGTRLKYGDEFFVHGVDDTCITVIARGGEIRIKKNRFDVIGHYEPASYKSNEEKLESASQANDWKYATQENVQQPAQSCGFEVNPRTNLRIPAGYAAWCKFLAAGGKLKFRSGCDVKFVAYVPNAKPHCQLVFLNPQTGNVVTRYADGKGSTETYDEPGDILVAE